ncbi:MAG TPA: alpha/beta fold hydrolase [Aggregatilineales bacterium]|nr:alpha/beta fold hydrolase [Anaerolineales bacterium]HRE49498.1 alpha/beta fold hydrolase [Aggregatilineales bacterium]
MSFALLDSPLILSIAFHPRPADPAEGERAGEVGIHSGTIPLSATTPEGEAVRLGYRLYTALPDQPLILYFHGNGEIAPDYDDIARFYTERAGASLLVVDYRGYGWSTGQPSFNALIGDVPDILAALPGIRAEGGISPTPPLVVMGRSLGSAPAIHLAHTTPEAVRGLILESAFTDILSLMIRLGAPGNVIGNALDPLGNGRKMREITLPTLILHGQEDTLIPIDHAERLYEASAAPPERKTLLRIPNAGHNDLLRHGLWDYFDAIAAFLKGL